MNLDAITDGVAKLYDKLEVWLESGIKMLPNLMIALLIIIFFWLLSRIVYKWTVSMFEKTHLNENIEHLLATMVRILVICLGIVFALGVLELQKTVFSLLAGVGVIGLALGFAFQDLASNFIAGVMLALRAPIKIGDVVKIKGTMGSVIDIRLRDTHIRNFDGQDIFIPNKDFTTNELTNYSSFGKRKIKIEVGVGYEDNQTEAVDVILEALNSVPGILKDPAPDAYIESLGDSCVNLFGQIWYQYPGGNYFQVRHDAINLVKKALIENGFNIPFPIRTLEAGESLKEVFSNDKTK
jgi:small-conductance mechanosensitive channel